MPTSFVTTLSICTGSIGDEHLFRIMYTADKDSNIISTPLRTIIGVSPIRIPYGTHIDEDMTLRKQNISENIFVLFFEYNKYIKIILAIIENPTAVYGNTASSTILLYNY